MCTFIVLTIKHKQKRKVMAKHNEGNLQKKLNTRREGRNLKSGARKKIASKSDLIRSMLSKHFSPSQIRQSLEKRGLSIYPSEIYRIQHAEYA